MLKKIEAKRIIGKITLRNITLQVLFYAQY